MRRSEFSNPPVRARGAAAFLVLLALAGSLLPAPSQARQVEGRPRRERGGPAGEIFGGKKMGEGDSPPPPARARGAAAFLVLRALAGSLLPAPSQARQVEGRPRRAGNAAAQQQPAQTRQTPTP